MASQAQVSDIFLMQAHCNQQMNKLKSQIIRLESDFDLMKFCLSNEAKGILSESEVNTIN